MLERVLRIVILVLLGAATSGCAAVVQTPAPTRLSAVSPTISPAPSRTAQPTTRPSPTASPLPSPLTGWRLLLEGSNLEPIWSPDGTHLLVSATRTFPDEVAAVYVLTPDGESVASVSDAALPVWIDSDRFLAYRWSTKPYRGESNHAPAFVGSIRSGQLVEFEAPYGWTVSNGLGAVAIGRAREREDEIARTDYIVWTGGDDATESRSGYPIRWSIEGDMLALLHPVTPTRGIGGWLEVVSWPGLDTIFEDQSEPVIFRARFSPTSEHVAYFDFVGDAPGPYNYFIYVVDLKSSETIRIAIDDHTDFRWNASGEIVALSAYGSIDTYSSAGDLIASEPVDPYVMIEASADGSTTLFSEGEEATAVSVGTVGSLVNIPLPEGTMPRLALSPNGDHVSVVLADPRQTNDWQRLFVYDL